MRFIKVMLLTNSSLLGNGKLIIGPFLIPLQVFILYARNAGETPCVNSLLVQLGVLFKAENPNKVSFLGSRHLVSSHFWRKVALRRQSGSFDFFNNWQKLVFSPIKMCFQEFTKVVHFNENGSAAKMIEKFTH